MCTEVDRARYARRLSGPLLDRIDLVCRLEAAPPIETEPAADAEAASPAVRRRVVAARALQSARLAGTAAVCNAGMDPGLTRRHVHLDARGRERLLEGHRGAPLTARGHDRVLRLARTIADLAGRERVEPGDVDEALGFRLAPQVPLGG